MSFLAPLFLLAAGAVALPILFHLIRRSTRETIPFSSLMFLKPTPPRVTRRSRLENLLLLLLRCLVLVLLAIGFARPFFQRPITADPAGDAGRQRLMLVDASASMKRPDLWSDAMERVAEVLEETLPSDQAALLAFDRDLITLLDFDEWNATPTSQRTAVARERLEGLSPSWKETDLAHALVTALERLEDLATDQMAGRREILLVTDLQAGANLDALQGLEWPEDIQVTLFQVQPDASGNAGFLALPDQPFTPGLSRTGQLRMRVQNAEDSEFETLTLTWAPPGSGPPVEVYVPPGQSRLLNLSWPSNASETASLRLEGDPQPFDNQFHVVRPRQETRPILFLGEETAEDPNGLLFYLQRAFPDQGGQRIEIVPSPAGASLPADVMEEARFMVLSGNPGSAAATRARQFLEAGKTLLHVLRHPSDTTALGTLLDTNAPAAREADLRNYAMLEWLDFQHPLLRPFADPQFNDFTKIHFWKMRQLDTNTLPGATVVARFDDQSPALLQFQVGPGQLFVLASGWNPADSQLALSSKFVPLLFSLLDLSGTLAFRPRHYTAGDTVSPPRHGLESLWTVETPDGTRVAVEGGRAFDQTDVPGIYRILPEPGEPFAVNLAPGESRTRPLSEDLLEQLGLPLRTSEAPPLLARNEARAFERATELEQRQKLWQWLLAAGLILLLTETWLAGRLSRSAAPGST